MLAITGPVCDRIDIDSRGGIDAVEIRAGLDELLAKSEGISGGTLRYRASGFSAPLLEEIAVEMADLPKLFALIERFDRCAVLTDSPWLKKIATFEGATLPDIEIRGFDLDEAGAAEAWLLAGAARKAD